MMTAKLGLLALVALIAPSQDAQDPVDRFRLFNIPLQRGFLSLVAR